jgi:tetratricopeptide (TPR) repeat protein
MQSHAHEPHVWPDAAGVIVLEGNPGEHRDAVVARWLARRGEHGGTTWRLRGRTEHGAWAGLDAALQALVAQLRDRAPGLLDRHGYELSLVAPALASELRFPQCLTDTAVVEERSRNFAADRAYRSLHGLVDLLGECDDAIEQGPWSIACDDYDEANGLIRLFLRHLVARRGTQLRLQVLVVVAAGRGAATASDLDPLPVTTIVRLAPTEPDAPAPRDDPVPNLADLEAQFGEGDRACDVQLARHIAACERVDPRRALRWQLVAMRCRIRDGCYEAALPYAAAVAAELPRLAADDAAAYMQAVTVLYDCYVPLGRADAARALVEQALARVDDRREEARCCYMLAMLHARFLETTDQQRAEGYLQRSFGALERAVLADDRRAFLEAFNMNGLALVRLRQGRPRAALELCGTAIARLDERLAPERHRLYRSVLLFNIAQVHAHLKDYERAIDVFGQAIEIDPNYSEYYNDRGAVFFKMERFEDAERDYLQAIALSPPYAEVWINLGQCYRAMMRMEDAVRAYARALDLDPTRALALVGRADAHAALGRAGLALPDYDRALALEPDQALVRASRAVVLYEAGRLHDAVADLDAAVELAPEVGELYQNRAVALRDLGRGGEAARDLETYLKLSPDAEDRGAVVASLAVLADGAS